MRRANEAQDGLALRRCVGDPAIPESCLWYQLQELIVDDPTSSQLLEIVYDSFAGDREDGQADCCICLDLSVSIERRCICIHLCRREPLAVMHEAESRAGDMLAGAYGVTSRW